MIRFELQVNTGASMHAIQEAALSADELNALTDGADLGVESGMGAMAVAQRVAYLAAELATKHHNMVSRERTDGEPDETKVLQHQAFVLAQATALLDLLVRHFNTMVIINKD
jgi:hypothetical protein